MKRNIIAAAVCIILAVLAVVQIIVDHIRDSELSEVAKQTEYCIFVDAEDKMLFLLQDGKCVKKYPIASGKPGWPSPIGSWKIVEKGDWGEGFGGRWMGLNVPWGKYGIHGTTQQETIGRAASHGCIRMYNKDVKELYNIVPAGTPVIIVNGCFGAFGTGFKTIKPGDRGADVLAVQLRLKDLGYFKGWPSGIYGEDLKHAVHRFQKDRGLPVKNEVSRKDYMTMGFKEFE